MSSLALSDSFEYLCYGSTAIRNILVLQRGDRLKSSESDVYRRQILSTKTSFMGIFILKPLVVGKLGLFSGM